LPHPAYSPDLAPSDFHLFGLLKDALEGKRFRADHEVTILRKDGRTNSQKTRFERISMKVLEQW